MAEPVPSDELEEEPSNYGALRSGTRLGRYELLVPIARGGMARVWAARLHGQRGFQKLVAVKVILPHLAEEPEFERMFLDEARIAACVHHPNVCEIYELGEENNVLYLAMEWVSGDSLARVLRAGGTTEAIDPRVAARVLADVCAGVHAAHELTDDDGRALGVVHRDLSPHNILITADGTAKVCDFGVAKALGQLHDATNVGQLKGKLAYMAPEQVTGATVDRRSDVFSLGCVLYEATTGQRPFRGEGEHQMMHAVLKGEVALPTSLMHGYPPALETIVMRALAPQPILRFATAERMRLALEEFLARGQLVTQSNVAQVMRARIGPAIDRRKERIRKASATGEVEGRTPDGTMTPSGRLGHRSGVQASNAGLSPMPPRMQPRESSAPSAFARPASFPPDSASRSVSLPPSPPAIEKSSANLPAPAAAPWASMGAPPPLARHYAAAIGSGVLLAFLIGGGGFVLWRKAHSPSAIGATAPTPTAPPVAEVADVEPPGSLAPREPEGPTKDIMIRLIPSDATLSVDGQDLPPGLVARPAPGATVQVLARAPGYEAATIVIDSSTASPIDLSLHVASPARDPAKGASKDSPKKAVLHSVVHPEKDPGLPANPY